MLYEIPGKKSLKYLKKGPHLFMDGASYLAEAGKTDEKDFMDDPPQVIIGKTEGSWIYDLEGNRYVDFHAGWASNPVGNANPEIIEAVHNAMKQYGFVYYHPLTYEVVERLAAISPDGKLTRTSFEVSGTEAVEAAVSMAIMKTGRPLIISFEDSFHGDSIATRMLGAMDSHRTKGFEAWRGGAIKVPYPHSWNAPAGMSAEQYTDFVLWYIDTFICEKIAVPESIAGVLVEPCLAEGGNWIPNKKFLPELKCICEKNGWVFISDEVLVGLGRTGKTWAIEHWGITPDLLVIGKHLTGGIEPIAVVQGTEEIMSFNEAHSGSTYAASPAGCAAALKTLEIFERDGLIERSERLGKKAAKRMANWKDAFSIVSDVRCIGLLLGIQIVNRENGMPDKDIAKAVYYEALKRGAWVINDHEDTIRLYPALNIDEDILSHGLDAIEEALHEVSKSGYRFNNRPSYPKA